MHAFTYKYCQLEVSIIASINKACSSAMTTTTTPGGQHT